MRRGRKEEEVRGEREQEWGRRRWRDGWMDVFGHGASPRTGRTFGQGIRGRETDGL